MRVLTHQGVLEAKQAEAGRAVVAPQPNDVKRHRSTYPGRQSRRRDNLMEVATGLDVRSQQWEESSPPQRPEEAVGNRQTVGIPESRTRRVLGGLLLSSCKWAATHWTPTTWDHRKRDPPGVRYRTWVLMVLTPPTIRRRAKGN